MGEKSLTRDKKTIEKNQITSGYGCLQEVVTNLKRRGKVYCITKSNFQNGGITDQLDRILVWLNRAFMITTYLVTCILTVISWNINFNFTSGTILLFLL